jgi:glutathione peroxidase
MQMEDVVGESSHAFYDWVREQAGDDNFPSWNFNKALIGADGELLATFNSGNIANRSNVQPELIEAIEAALAS